MTRSVWRWPCGQLSVALAALVAAVTLSCGGGPPSTSGARPASSNQLGAQSPAPTGGASTAPTQPTPAAPTPNLLGAVAGRVASTTSAGPCGRFPGGYAASLNLGVNTSVYVLTIEIPGYLQPGEYPAPPARVSLHPAHSLQPILYVGVRGSVSVATDERSGRVNEVMTSDSGSVTASGPWTCS